MDTEALLNRPYFSFKHGIYKVKRPAEVSNAAMLKISTFDEPNLLNFHRWRSYYGRISFKNDKLMDLVSVLNEVSVIVYMP